jgi:hypothetical protein
MTQILDWMQMPSGLLVVGIAFAAISFAGYFTIHELNGKDVRKIEKNRNQVMRNHLSELVKKCEETKQVTDDLENKFFSLFQNEYESVHEPSRLLNSIDRFLLFSGILFSTSILLDWANDNFSFISSTSSLLFPVAFLMFIYGLVLLAVGLFNVERLRRITAKEPDLDPPPFEASLFIGFLLSLDLLFLYITISEFSNLTPFGMTLFVFSLLPLIGAPLAFLTWEKKSLKRTFGLILLVAPFILLFAWILLSALNIL